MIEAGNEPLIRVGLLAEPELNIELKGEFRSPDGVQLPAGTYAAKQADGAVRLDGPVTLFATPTGSDGVTLTPVDFDSATFVVHGVTIGIDFHWQRKESQTFQGSLIVKPDERGLRVINELPLESYLVSVISSEMSASSPAELLKAHAIISRSWLLAQLSEKGGTESPTAGAAARDSALSPDEIIRWYTREAHSDFDVCSDDHCQRYQGVGKALSEAAFDAVSQTRGQVLVSDGEICDARYSKCCGGMTERYSAAWDDKSVPYLAPVYDGPGEIEGYTLPLSVELNAERWITSSPPAFCNVISESVLSRILPGFDQETADFYRWKVSYSAAELGEIVRDRLGIDLGGIRDLIPVERGDSGRIIRLRITGEKRTFVIGKELEIRRALSRSHLYSSAFAVRTEDTPRQGRVFTLFGAGWGHGVGLCQIGAASMAENGYSHPEILAHYFKRSRLNPIY